MKPYSTNPGEAKAAKYARKSKRVATRVKLERQHKKAARVVAAMAAWDQYKLGALKS